MNCSVADLSKSMLFDLTLWLLKKAEVQDAAVQVAPEGQRFLSAPMPAAPSSCRLWANRGPLARSSNCGSNSADVGPHLECTPSCRSTLAGGGVIAAEVEEVVVPVMGGEEALRLAG